MAGGPTGAVPAPKIVTRHAAMSVETGIVTGVSRLLRTNPLCWGDPFLERLTVLSVRRCADFRCRARDEIWLFGVTSYVKSWLKDGALATGASAIPRGKYFNALAAVCGRWCVCLASMLVLLAVLHPVDAMSAGWSQVTVTAHGVRLTLSIRRHAYPQNALVRVWTRMQNVTTHQVLLYANGPQRAGEYIPQVVVLAAPRGKPLPISLTDYVPGPGPLPSSISLPAGAVRNIPEIVILRGPFLRLDLTLSADRHVPAREGATVSTPLLHLNLTTPDSPTVTLHVPPDKPSATIEPVGPVRGDLFGEWYWACGNGGFNEEAQQRIYWTAIGRLVVPACSSIVGWHEIAGWLNHSVAEIDWGQKDCCYSGSQDRAVELQRTDVAVNKLVPMK
jgi:hypothetical protein